MALQQPPTRRLSILVPCSQQLPTGHSANPSRYRRKYFSDLERLQIQQQQTVNDYDCDCLAPAPAPFHPPLNLLNRRRARRQISQAEAQFFLSLPPKVRKQQFSREEQIILFSQCDQLFPLPLANGLDEAASQRLNDFDFDFPSKPTPPPKDNHEFRSRSFSNSSWSPRRSSFATSPRTADSSAQSGMFLFDPMSSAYGKVFVTPGHRRTRSLSNPASRHSTTSPLLGPRQDSLPFVSPSRPKHQRAQTTQLPGRSHLQFPTSTLVDPEATHYRDPEARKKLRTYLAPQKFDEAIQFGFSAAPEKDAIAPHYQLPPITTHARKFSRDMYKYLKDGRHSFLDYKSTDNQGLESDGESVMEVESPATPSSTGMSFRLHSRHMSSMDSTGLPSTQSSICQLNREMTLRMTLTRPDLRAEDEKLYGWQAQHSQPTLAKENPLALEDLVLSDDQNGTMGPFYVKPKARGGLVTRLLKRASPGGRP
jgi:hypothetical protein